MLIISPLNILKQPKEESIPDQHALVVYRQRQIYNVMTYGKAQVLPQDHVELIDLRNRLTEIQGDCLTRDAVYLSYKATVVWRVVDVKLHLDRFFNNDALVSECANAVTARLVQSKPLVDFRPWSKHLKILQQKVHYDLIRHCMPWGIYVTNVNIRRIALLSDLNSEPVSTVKGQDDLLFKMNSLFRLDDIEDICFSLSIDIENLKGETRKAKIRELIRFHKSRNQLSVLCDTCRKLRPDIEWMP